MNSPDVSSPRRKLLVGHAAAGAVGVLGLEGQRQIVGGVIHGAAIDLAELSVLVRKGAGMRLILLRDGQPVQTAPVTSDEQTITPQGPIGTGGYVRAGLRGVPEVDPANPVAGRLNMESPTNPIFLVASPRPASNEPQTASSPADQGASA